MLKELLLSALRAIGLESSCPGVWPKMQPFRSLWDPWPQWLWARVLSVLQTLQLIAAITDRGRDFVPPPILYFRTKYLGSQGLNCPQ